MLLRLDWMVVNTRLCIKYDLWYLSVFYWRAVVIARGTEEQEDSLACSRGLMHHFLQSFGAIVRIWTLECCACCVTDIGQDLDRFFEHDPECVSSPITTKSSIVLSQGLFFLIFNDLYIHLVVRGPMNRSIQTESNYRDSSVNCEPGRKKTITK